MTGAVLNDRLLFFYPSAKFFWNIIFLSGNGTIFFFLLCVTTITFRSTGTCTLPFTAGHTTCAFQGYPNIIQCASLYLSADTQYGTASCL